MPVAGAPASRARRYASTRSGVRLPHVRHHRVALGEVVPLRPLGLPPCGLDGPRSSLKRHGHCRVQAVELAEEGGVRLSGRGEERVEDHRLTVEREIAPAGLEFGEREPPVHPAPRRAVLAPCPAG